MRILQSWSSEQLGQPPHATFRALLPIPGGVALGSDYGLVLWRDGAFSPFPFPKGARREMRAVTDLALHDGSLWVATERGHFEWPFSGIAAGKGFPQDGTGGFDDLRALHAAPGRLLMAWRTHLDGGDGPPEGMSFCTAWQDRVFMGTRDGRLHHIDAGPIRTFEHAGKGRPVRHLAYACGHVWAAAAAALWRWDGTTWDATPGEPVAMAVDARDRLWTLGQGRLWCSPFGDWPEPVAVPLQRPWQLTAVDDTLWVGRRGGVTLLG